MCKWYIVILIYSASSIKQHSAGRHVVPLGHVNLIQVNQSFLLHLNDAHCILETINTNCTVSNHDVPQTSE